MIAMMMMIPVELEILTHGVWAVRGCQKLLVEGSMPADRDAAETAGRADHGVVIGRNLEPGPRPLTRDYVGTETTTSGSTTLQRKK